MYVLGVASLLLLGYFLLVILKRLKRSNGFDKPSFRDIFDMVLTFRDTRKLLLEACVKYTTEIAESIDISIWPFKRVLLTTDDKLVQFILNSDQTQAKSSNYEFVHPWLGSGLLTCDGPKYKQDRKIVTSAFQVQILREFVGIFDAAGTILTDKLKKYDNCSNVHLSPLVASYSLDCVCESATGVKINAQEDESSPYVQDVRNMCKLFINRNTTPIKFFNWSFRWTADYVNQKNLVKSLHSFTEKVIEDKKASGTENTSTEKGKTTLLNSLLTYSNGGTLLSYENIREQVDTFMFAGSDTTSAGIAFTLYCLANHPEAQEKVLAEQKSLFGDDKNPQITYRQLQNMKYLELVIKETLRLYPPIPLIGRSAKEDMNFDGRIISKNTDVLLFIFGVHRNPKFFPEPDRFIPERFETIDNSSAYFYIPFSAGKRSCIGQKFSFLQMKTIISKIVRQFELKPADPKQELVLVYDLTLKSIDGIKVGLKSRPR